MLPARFIGRIIANNQQKHSLKNSFRQNARSMASSGSKEPIKTVLYDFHVKNNGKMVNFGGFLLPVQYSDLSITGSHLHTRDNASVFDVSHMLQTEIKGSDSIDIIESLCTADIKSMKDGSSTLTVFTNENGGILDDLIITKVENNHLYIVSNAARSEHDIHLMLKGIENYKSKYPQADVQIKFYNTKERALLALQGPKSAEILQSLVKNEDLYSLYFMESVRCNIAGVDARVTRCGYTGEDGFELSIPAEKAEKFANELLKQGGESLRLAGLGARDSLRLEAGLCLYGNDIDDRTTPVEAGLTWLVAKRRRALRDFPGAPQILHQIKEGVSQKRIGMLSQKGPPARSHTDIYIKAGLDFTKIGTTTSGCPSPSLPGQNIAMGYVATAYSKPGMQILLRVREKFYEAQVVKMPFVQTKYYVNKK